MKSKIKSTTANSSLPPTFLSFFLAIYLPNISSSSSSSLRYHCYQVRATSLCKLQTAMKAPAHFFKFIPPASNSHLPIPKSFRKYIKTTRKNKVVILRRGDQKWAVKMADDWVFAEGWDDFMTANGVQDFDIVVFKHQGNMVFNIMVFDPSWSEKEYSNTRVKEFANTMIHDQNQHPYFVGTLKQYATLIRMYMPKKFVLANGLSTGEMILKDAGNEGLWKVKLRNHLGRSFCIQRGLHEFCTAIGLQKGDRFRFELIHHGRTPVAVVSRLPDDGLVDSYFRSTVTADTIKRAYMNVPMPFARSYKLDMRNCDMCVMDEKRRLWPTILRYQGDRVCIRGLRGMLVANGVKEGDEFSLELVDNGDKPLMNFYKSGMVTK